MTDFYFADVDAPDTEHGYVGSIFAATETTMSVVPVSVDELPPSTGAGPGPSFTSPTAPTPASRCTTWMAGSSGHLAPVT